MIDAMTRLVFQISLIIIASKAAGLLFQKMKMPSVLGELIAGVIIGPYLLGKIPLPGFPEGFFPYNHAMNFPVSVELYSLATIASIILLFFSGLETDFRLFLQYSIPASVIGISGVVFSFFFGTLLSTAFLHVSFMSPVSLFLGCISTATSVGITARILSQRRKIGTPEGVTILTAAVIDDVLGIILFSIVLAFTTISNTGKDSNIDWTKIIVYSLKVFFIWLLFTSIGLLAAQGIGKALKIFRSKMTISLLSLAMALFFSGLFEKSGLAMIVGAYVMGLTLSRTDLSFVIKESLNPLEMFFVPMFFTIMGMLFDPRIFLDKGIVIFGAVFTLVAIMTKIIGCALPSCLFNFNKTGALRIGLGMIPRGEVALIIAGIALSSSIFDEKIFGVAVMMTMLTSLISPPFIDISFKSDKKGVKKKASVSEENEVVLNFQNPDLSKLILDNVLENFAKEGFFISQIDPDSSVFYIRKNKVFLKLYWMPDKIEIKAKKEDMGFINAIAYESFIKLHDTSLYLKNLTKPAEMIKDIVTVNGSGSNFDLIKYIDPACILMSAKSKNKEKIISELVDVLAKNKKIREKKSVLDKVLSREKSMSTGLQNGLAIPHARSKHVDKVEIAVGISKKGIDFDSIDGLPAKIFFLIISPEKNSPHLEILAYIGSLFNDKESVEKIVNASDALDLMNLLKRSR